MLEGRLMEEALPGSLAIVLLLDGMRLRRERVAKWVPGQSIERPISEQALASVPSRI